MAAPAAAASARAVSTARTDASAVSAGASVASARRWHGLEASDGAQHGTLRREDSMQA